MVHTHQEEYYIAIQWNDVNLHLLAGKEAHEQTRFHMHTTILWLHVVRHRATTWNYNDNLNADT